MFDTHAVARALTEADLTPAQADAITDAVRLAAEHDAAAIDIETLATKADVAGVEAALKSDVAAVEVALKSDVAAVKSDVAAVQANVAAVEVALKSDVAALEARMRADMAALELRLVKWIVGTGVGVAGLVIAALRLLD